MTNGEITKEITENECLNGLGRHATVAEYNEKLDAAHRSV